MCIRDRVHTVALHPWSPEGNCHREPPPATRPPAWCVATCVPDSYRRRKPLCGLLQTVLVTDGCLDFINSQAEVLSNELCRLVGKKAVSKNLSPHTLDIWKTVDHLRIEPNRLPRVPFGRPSAPPVNLH